MKVSDLIQHLKQLPQDREVAIFWDGNPRGFVEGIVLDDSEVVIVGEWSIYRSGEQRAYPEDKIVFSA